MIQSLVWNIFPLTFAATSALISSWVSARRFLASSVLRSQSAMKDSRWSTAYGSKEICYQTDNQNISLQQNTNVPNDFKNIKEIKRWLWSGTYGPVCIIMIVIFPINAAWKSCNTNVQWDRGKAALKLKYIKVLQETSCSVSSTSTGLVLVQLLTLNMLIKPSAIH